jgi:hypothetical protein
VALQAILLLCRGISQRSFASAPTYSVCGSFEFQFWLCDGRRDLSGNLPRLRPPLDPFPYPRDQRSRRADATLPDGLFAFVQDECGQVWVVPDGPHIHPKVLGGGQLAMYAGDMRVSQGRIEDVTNLSGTFQFDDPVELLAVADQLIRQGLTVRPGAVRLFPADGSPPQVLR